jgi:membrane protein
VSWKNVKAAWSILKETIREFSQDRVLRLSAATAYYAIFSIGPLLVLVVGLAGLAMGEDRVRQEVVRQLEGWLGPKSASLIESMMTTHRNGGSLLATVIGGAALVFGAAGIFGQLQDSLNTIWGVTSRPGKSIGAFIRDRFFSMTMVLGIGFLLLISMVLTALVNGFAEYIGSLILLPDWVAPAFNVLLSLGVVCVLFALIFKVLPDVKIRWKDVWVGAAGTAILFTIGQHLLGWYLGRQSTASAYGAGSAFVVVLLYVYYAAILLYLGAEFTQVCARRRGSTIEPSKYAVQMTHQQRAEQGMPRTEQVEEAARRSESQHRPSSSNEGAGR